ncbi:CBO0543 family protein [Peribacillus acanthi]|uniref:CBO0543 family protein n=1 Tax=Peribacillus acanthi TaxID=2171554 RepID=UPI000D3EDCD2|nr:CBO0543 family protein [Peribacillus acanthi]
MVFSLIKPIQSQDRLEKVGKFYEEITKVHIDYYHYWKEATFLHWDFLLSLAFTIIPPIIWWKVHKKESRMRLLVAGLFITVITSWLDFLGTIYGLWYYTGKVLPTLPSYIPWDFCIFPVLVMLIIQYKPHVAAWKKALFFASFSSFIGEPLFWWLGFYVLNKWSMLYSFPIYFVLFLIAHRLSQSKHFESV